ncbi:hypothetical protein HYW59_00720 [Candidatus Kaiserbacteria bacterium]|nr:hypothetical protein [Candidatus Kaiserbacteria bacterium]
MIDEKYTYLLLGIFFALAWLFLYIRRKDERPKLLSLSLPLAVLGIGADALYVKDWWTPVTVIGTPPLSGEALIASFGIIGVAAVLPEYLLRMRDTSPRTIFTLREIHVLCVTFFSMALLFYGSFFLLGTNSLIATVLALVIPTAFMWGARRDLIKVALLNGLLLVLFSIPIYAALNYLTPSWIDSFYMFKNTPHLLFVGVPIDDVIFYFCSGLFFGTFYEWWQHIHRIPLVQGHRRVTRWWQRLGF